MKSHPPQPRDPAPLAPPRDDAERVTAAALGDRRGEVQKNPAK